MVEIEVELGAKCSHGLGVSSRMCQVLADTVNKSLADNSWCIFNTIEAHIKKCVKELGRPLSFPFSRKDALNLVGYL